MNYYIKVDFLFIGESKNPISFNTKINTKFTYLLKDFYLKAEINKDDYIFYYQANTISNNNLTLDTIATSIDKQDKKMVIMLSKKSKSEKIKSTNSRSTISDYFSSCDSNSKSGESETIKNYIVEENKNNPNKNNSTNKFRKFDILFCIFIFVIIVIIFVIILIGILIFKNQEKKIEKLIDKIQILESKESNIINLQKKKKLKIMKKFLKKE